MTDAIRPLIAGNWKMNGLKSALGEFEAMIESLAQRSIVSDDRVGWWWLRLE